MPKGVYQHPQTPIEQRFWKKIAKGDGCWNWIGPAPKAGARYPQVQRGKRGEGRVLAHRLAWELTFGSIPDGMNVLHRCDNTLCVRPDHLFLGTQLDNMRDMHAKGRASNQVGTYSNRFIAARKEKQNGTLKRSD